MEIKEVQSILTIGETVKEHTNPCHYKSSEMISPKCP